MTSIRPWRLGRRTTALVRCTPSMGCCPSLCASILSYRVAASSTSTHKVSNLTFDTGLCKRGCSSLAFTRSIGASPKTSPARTDLCVRMHVSPEPHCAYFEMAMFLQLFADVQDVAGCGAGVYQAPRSLFIQSGVARKTTQLHHQQWTILLAINRKMCHCQFNMHALLAGMAKPTSARNWSRLPTMTSQNC
ncbi:hypothetical protein BKA63DRAFT_97990 [Paraphoma chrysanthemicola]|nr:hypothetical protein BKA63DRAFT_97990 [Paraphoma chrysanthemicola]